MALVPAKTKHHSVPHSSFAEVQSLFFGRKNGCCCRFVAPPSCFGRFWTNALCAVVGCLYLQASKHKAKQRMMTMLRTRKLIGLLGVLAVLIHCVSAHPSCVVGEQWGEKIWREREKGWIRCFFFPFCRALLVFELSDPQLLFDLYFASLQHGPAGTNKIKSSVH